MVQQHETIYRPGRKLSLPPSLRRYGVALVVSLVALLVRALLAPILGDNAPLLVFVAAVTISAWYGGLGPGLFATVISAVAGLFFFIRPFYSVMVPNSAELARLLIFLGEGVLISTLTAARQRARRRADRSAQDVLASEERFRLLVESVSDYALFMLDARGCVVLWNSGAEHLNGYTAEEVIGQSQACFYPPESVARGEPEQQLQLAATQGRLRIEGWRQRKDGTRYWADEMLTALRGPDGDLRGFAKVVHDVTERKQAEERILQLNQSLERRVRERTVQLEDAVADLDAFAATVSHDLRAPLRGIRGFARIVLDDHAAVLDADSNAYIQRIAATAERMDLLIQDLLAYSRLDHTAFTLQPVALQPLLGRVLDDLTPEIEAQGARVMIAGPLPAVCGHAPLLSQICSNLLSNALKFTRPGVPPEVHVWAETSGDRVRLWVADRGIGIAPAAQERIFSVFERLHGSEHYPGTGVGLAIVRKGVERMGGRVGVESREGVGSRFWVELRRAEVAGD